MALTRDVSLTELPVRGLQVNSATAAYTIVPSDSGVVCFNDYGTDTTYTLPAVADAKGKLFWFVNGEATTKTIITAPTACIKGPQAAVCTTLTSKAIGDHVILTCDGTNYFVISMGFAVWTLA